MASSRLADFWAVGRFAFATCGRGAFSGSEDRVSADACVQATALRHAIVNKRRFIAAPSKFALVASPFYELLIKRERSRNPQLVPVRSHFRGRPPAQILNCPASCGKLWRSAENTPHD